MSKYVFNATAKKHREKGLTDAKGKILSKHYSCFRNNSDKAHNFEDLHAIGRQLKKTWSDDIILKAAQFIVSFSTKAKQSRDPIRIKIVQAHRTMQELHINQTSPYKQNI